MTFDELRRFCDPGRPDLALPRLAGGWTVATDGKGLVAVPGALGGAQPQRQEWAFFVKVLDDADRRPTVALGTLSDVRAWASDGETRRCDVCEGKAICPRCGVSCTAEGCDGGEIWRSPPGLLAGVMVERTTMLHVAEALSWGTGFVLATVVDGFYVVLRRGAGSGVRVMMTKASCLVEPWGRSLPAVEVR